MSGYASSPNSSTAQPSRSRPPATARLLQHEYDHLDGILYLDHLKSHEDLVDLSKLEEAKHQHDFEVEVEDEGLMKSRGEKRVLVAGDLEDGVAVIKDEKIVEATEKDLERLSGG